MALAATKGRGVQRRRSVRHGVEVFGDRLGGDGEMLQRFPGGSIISRLLHQVFRLFLPAATLPRALRTQLSRIFSASNSSRASSPPSRMTLPGLTFQLTKIHPSERAMHLSVSGPCCYPRQLGPLGTLTRVYFRLRWVATFSSNLMTLEG